MTLQKRLLKIMRQRNMRVADLARHLEVPYTTVREWVLNGRMPSTASVSLNWINHQLRILERNRA